MTAALSYQLPIPILLVAQLHITKLSLLDTEMLLGSQISP